jgi:hypothetical protein
VYCHLAKDGQVLYVGKSIDPKRRSGEHRKSSPWGARIATITVEWYSTEKAAREAEASMIELERPPHNVAGVLTEGQRRVRDAKLERGRRKREARERLTAEQQAKAESNGRLLNLQMSTW